MAFLGRNPATGKKVRLSRSNEDELKRAINDYYKQLESGGEDAVCLDRAQARDAKTAFDLIKQHSLDMTLEECVRAVIGGAPQTSPAQCATSVGEAWQRFAEAIATKSEAYRRCVTSRVGRWISSFGRERPLSDVTAANLKEYLMSNIYRPDEPRTAKTYNNVLGDIKTFIHWCCSREQGFLGADPLDGMKKMEIGYRQPEYMKASDVKRLFGVLEAHKSERPAVLADAILSFFCGMRTVEIQRVREGDEAVKISLEDHFIRVVKCKGSLRGIRPRAFRIPQQAEAWMRSFDFSAAVRIPNPNHFVFMKKYAKEAKIKMPKNAGRHTFITMFEAAHHDEHALSAIVGNTESVRSRSYNGVELEREGKAYFDILPAESASAKRAD